MIWTPDKALYNVYGLTFVGLAIAAAAAPYMVRSCSRDDRKMGWIVALVALSVAYSIMEDVYIYGEKALHGVVSAWGAAIAVTTLYWRAHGSTSVRGEHRGAHLDDPDDGVRSGSHGDDRGAVVDQ